MISGGVGAEGSEMLSSLLAASPPEQQKHILGERLYPLVAHHQVKSFVTVLSPSDLRNKLHRMCVSLCSLI